MIYVIGERRRGVVKIGRAEDPRSRLGHLQVGNPRPLRLLATFPGDRPLEAHLHQTFTARRVAGEWFDFGAQDAVDLVSHEVSISVGHLGTFATIEPGAQRGPRFTRTRQLARDLAVLDCLAENVGPNQKVKAALKVIADKVGTDHNSVVKSIERLCAAKLIEVTRPGSGGGYPTIYRVLEKQGAFDFEGVESEEPFGRRPLNWTCASPEDQARTGMVT